MQAALDSAPVQCRMPCHAMLRCIPHRASSRCQRVTPRLSNQSTRTTPFTTVDCVLVCCPAGKQLHLPLRPVCAALEGCTHHSHTKCSCGGVFASVYADTKSHIGRPTCATYAKQKHRQYLTSRKTHTTTNASPSYPAPSPPSRKAPPSPPLPPSPTPPERCAHREQVDRK
jgi:hypothetical protein